MSVLLDDLEREKLLVSLNRVVLELPANEAFDVEDRVVGVCRGLRFRRVPDQPFAIAGGIKRDVRRRNAIALVIGHDLDTAVFEDADT